MKQILMGCATAAVLALAATTEAMSPPQLSLEARRPVARLPLGVTPIGPAKFGLASWYGSELQGRPTASGQPFDDKQLTAAIWNIPLGSRLLVTNLKNKKSVVVRVNDRGPNHKFRNRVVDLSRAAAKQLGFIGEGLTQVRVQMVTNSRQ